jgi:hypothetical protein
MVRSIPIVSSQLSFDAAAYAGLRIVPEIELAHSMAIGPKCRPAADSHPNAMRETCSFSAPCETVAVSAMASGPQLKTMSAISHRIAVSWSATP